MCLAGYSALSLSRPDCSGDGIAIVYNKTSISALTNPVALVQWNAVMSQSPHQR